MAGQLEIARSPQDKIAELGRFMWSNVVDFMRYFGIRFSV